MELILLKFLAFLRPVMFIDTGFRFGGFNLFELAAILFSGIIIGAFAIRAATYKNVNLSITDLAIGGFVFWCMAIYVIYINKAHIDVLAKFVIPLLTYIVAKSVIPNREEYLKMLWLLILGFSIPVFASAVLIFHGTGIERINYWTGVPRYEGVYNGAHDMGHNAAFLLMAIWIYLLLLKERQILFRDLSIVTKGLIVLLICAAMYLLYKSHVRTTIVGLAVFGTVLLAMYYKRPLLIFIVATILVSSFMLSEDIQKRFFPEESEAERSTNFDVTDYGSNRPTIWMSQVRVFGKLPIDEQLAGIGIGNTLAEETGDVNNYILNLDTHNDFLRVMVHTGIVGLLLFVGLQLAILSRILSLGSGGKYAFLAIFCATAVMNLVSNSYVDRFGLAQMLYLAMAYVELPSKKEEAVKTFDPGSSSLEVANLRPHNRVRMFPKRQAQQKR